MMHALARGGPALPEPTPADPSGEAAARAALGVAIAKRAEVANVLETATADLAKGDELLAAAKAEVAKIGDVDAEVASHRTRAVREQLDSGGPVKVLEVPAALANKVRRRADAERHVEAVEAVCGELRSELADAQATHAAADCLVSVRVQAVLHARAEALAYELAVASGRVCALDESLHALAVLWVPQNGKMAPIGLPPSALGGMQMAEPLAGDVRRRRVAAMRTPGMRDGAAEDWRSAYEQLQQDADAPLP